MAGVARSMVFELLTAEDLESVSFVCRASRQWISQHLVTRRSMTFEAMNTLPLASRYCRGLEVVDIVDAPWMWERDEQAVSALVNLITRNTATFQDLQCRGASYPVHSPILLKALQSCPSLRSFHVHFGWNFHFHLCHLKDVVGLPSLTSLSLSDPSQENSVRNRLKLSGDRRGRQSSSQEQALLQDGFF